MANSHPPLHLGLPSSLGLLKDHVMAVFLIFSVCVLAVIRIYGPMAAAHSSGLPFPLVSLPYLNKHSSMRSEH